MEIKYTKDGLENVTYIVVDVQSKAYNNLETKGLFIALRPVADRPSVITGPDDIFIWICASGNVHMFNTEYYNIISITLGFKQKTVKFHQTVYKESEQPKALEKMKSIQSAMKELGRIKETGLMDLSVYAGLPKIFENLLQEKDEDNIGNRKRTSYGIHRPLGNSNYRSSYIKPKEIETLYMKRTTKYPIRNALKAMESKINDDKHKPAKLKEIPADNIKEATAEAEADINGDIYAGLGGFCN